MAALNITDEGFLPVNLVVFRPTRERLLYADMSRMERTVMVMISDSFSKRASESVPPNVSLGALNYSLKDYNDNGFFLTSVNRTGEPLTIALTNDLPVSMNLSVELPSGFTVMILRFADLRTQA